ncbi:MAG: hypothetical protein Fur0044_51090 [Anaerolineae bacterium]|nr:hypothetical protein [Anaerolineae bacterium]
MKLKQRVKTLQADNGILNNDLGTAELEAIANDTVSPEQQALNDAANQRGGGNEALAPSDE